MVPDLLLYQFLLVALVLIYCMIHVGWPDNLSATSKISEFITIYDILCLS